MIARTGLVVRDLLLLALRLYFGVRLAMAGLGKAQDLAATEGYFASLGIPSPGVAVYGCVAAELLGGGLLAAGLLSHLAGFLVFANMTVAYWYGHRDSVLALGSDPSKFLGEAAFLFWLTGGLVWGTGGGVWSLDAFLGIGARPRRQPAKQKAQ